MQKIIIHSVPRSGSTWLGNIFNSHSNVAFKMQPLFSYAFKDKLNTISTKQEIEYFFKNIYKSKDNFLNQKEGIKRGIIPEFTKSMKPTHICYKEVRYHHILENLLNKCTDIKVVLLIRNPLAVLYSWKNAPKEFKIEKGWEFEEEWLNAPSKNLEKLEEYNGYNKWKEATLLFLKLKENYPKNVMIVKYSDLLTNVEKTVKELFLFSDLQCDTQTVEFLKSSTLKNQTDAYSVFKIRKKDNDWEKLPNNIIDFIKNDLKENKLSAFLNE